MNSNSDLNEYSQFPKQRGRTSSPYGDEVSKFLARRRQTRFMRHYGGPILAVMVSGLCAWYVWSVATRGPKIDEQQRLVHKQIWQDLPAKRTSPIGQIP
jgi:hypothetical protein